MTKLGIVVPYLKAGGTERQALKIQAAAAEHGVEAQLIVIQRIGELLALAPPDDTIFLDTAFGRLNAPIIVASLTRLLRRERFDLVLSRAWNTNVLTAAAARITRTPTLLYLSSNSRVDDRSRARIMLERYIFSRARFVAVCQQAARNFQDGYNVEGDRVHCIYNGVDVASVRGMAGVQDPPTSESGSGRKIRIGFMGRLTRRKGLDVLLDAANQLVLSGETLPPWEINVIGGGEDRTALETQARRYRLPVTFHGEKANPFPLLRCNDLFVLPSRAEGFPNALLEAMALGLASIAADCPTGPSEVIREGENGCMFPVGNADALADCLKRLIGDADLRRRIGAAAVLTIAERFSSQRQMERIFRLVKEVSSQ